MERLPKDLQYYFIKDGELTNRFQDANLIALLKKGKFEKAENDLQKLAIWLYHHDQKTKVDPILRKKRYVLHYKHKNKHKNKHVSHHVSHRKSKNKSSILDKIKKVFGGTNKPKKSKEKKKSKERKEKKYAHSISHLPSRIHIAKINKDVLNSIYPDVIL